MMSGWQSWIAPPTDAGLQVLPQLLKFLLYLLHLGLHALRIELERTAGYA
jgi:hypothetical protein